MHRLALLRNRANNRLHSFDEGMASMSFLGLIKGDLPKVVLKHLYTLLFHGDSAKNGPELLATFNYHEAKELLKYCRNRTNGQLQQPC